MGLLSKLTAGRTHLEASPASADVTPAPRSPSTFTCSACQSHLGWIDRYNGGPHCSSCRPAPSQSLVASLIGDWPGEKTTTQFSDSEKGVADRNHLDAKGEAVSPAHLAAAEAQGRTITTLDESGAADRARDAADAILARRIAYQIDFTERMDRKLGRPPTVCFAIADPSPRA
jgi:hypothetical protein